MYTEVVPNYSKATLQATIRSHIALDKIIHSDRWRGYNGLVDAGFDKHFRILTMATMSLPVAETAYQWYRYRVFLEFCKEASG